MQNPCADVLRPEVVRAQQRASLGTIQINTPVAFWAVSLIAAGFIAVAGAYLYVGHYTRRTWVDGVLVPAAGLVTMSATKPGEVLSVYVQQGQRVAAGQKLAELNDPDYSAAVGNTPVFITSELKSERANLKRDLVSQDAVTSSEEVTLRQGIVSLREQLQQIRDQLVLQRKEAAAMMALLKRIGPLARTGIISAYDLQQQLATAYNAEVKVKDLERQREAIMEQISEAGQKLQQAPLALATQQDVTRDNLAQVEQALAQNEAQRAWVVEAPRAGMIGTLLIRPGDAVVAGEPLLTIVPTGSPLEAQLLVPSAAIGFIRQGQRAVLRYQAFPYQKFGLEFGVVDQVSESALSPGEVAALVGKQTSEPLYRVLVQLESQNVEAYGRRVGLRPGMALDADILLEQRRLFEWVLEPLYGFGRERLAEPRESRSTPSRPPHA